EVADARQRGIDQPVQEVVHAVAAQRHHHPDRHAGAQLERGDRALRPRDHRLLAGDRGDVAAGGVQRLAVLDRLAQTDVDSDPLAARDLLRVLVAELAFQRRRDLLSIATFHSGHRLSPPRRHSAVRSGSTSPERLAKRTFVPSARNRNPTFVGSPVLGSTIATLEMSSGAGCSMMPAWRTMPRGLTCFFAMLTLSTT